MLSKFITVGLLCMLGGARAYKIAVVSDIHADLNYNPLSPLCISKSLPPAFQYSVNDNRFETYAALKT